MSTTQMLRSSGNPDRVTIALTAFSATLHPFWRSAVLSFRQRIGTALSASRSKLAKRFPGTFAPLARKCQARACPLPRILTAKHQKTRKTFFTRFPSPHCFLLPPVIRPQNKKESNVRQWRHSFVVQWPSSPSGPAPLSATAAENCLVPP